MGSPRAAHLDEGVVEELAGRPAQPRLALQAAGEEVLSLQAQPLRDRGLVAHAHFIHNLKIVFIFMPRPLEREKNQVLGLHGHKKPQILHLFLGISTPSVSSKKCEQTLTAESSILKMKHYFYNYSKCAYTFREDTLHISGAGKLKGPHI